MYSLSQYPKGRLVIRSAARGPEVEDPSLTSTTTGQVLQQRLLISGSVGVVRFVSAGVAVASPVRAASWKVLGTGMCRVNRRPTSAAVSGIIPRPAPSIMIARKAACSWLREDLSSGVRTSRAPQSSNYAATRITAHGCPTGEWFISGATRCTHGVVIPNLGDHATRTP